MRFLLAALLVAAPVACAREGVVEPPENLLLVTLDTTRADYVTGFGGEQGVTPRIARLAKRSAVFSRARSDTNVTNPSHLAIHSGLSFRSHGVANNRTDLPESVDTLPEAFSRAGFDTAGFVAAEHLGAFGWRGFDTLEGPATRFTGRQVTRRAVDWLRKHRDPGRRFFLWVHYFDPHMLYLAPVETIRLFYDRDPTAGDAPPIAERPEFRKGFPRKAIQGWVRDIRDLDWPLAMYSSALHEADAQLARLLRALPAGERTAIVLVADHGESLGEHDIYYDHRQLYETQLRIPLLFHVPGLSPLRSDLPVSTLDIAPTVAELFRLDLRNALEGRSLLSLLAGEPDPSLREPRSFVSEHSNRSSAALREGDWKLLWQRRAELPYAPGVELYHLGRDPEEQSDLSQEEPRRAAAMRERLEELASDADAALPVRELGEEAKRRLRELGYADP